MEVTLHNPVSGSLRPSLARRLAGTPIIRLALLAVPLLLAALAGPAAAQDLYRIRAGDVLRIEVIEDETLNRSVLVAPDGRISLPLAGSLQAAGRPVEAVMNSITERLAPNFASPPNVFVAVERLADRPPAAPQVAAAPVPDPVIEIFILGEASNPGMLEADPGTTVLEAFSRMGGFTPYAATHRIQLRRRDASGQETIFLLDYEAILDGRSPNGTAELSDGDVIVVPERRLFE